MIRYEHLEALRNAMLSYVDIDSHTPVADNFGQYTVRSIYFDTYKLDYYYEKRMGIKLRKKIRIRSYNDLAYYEDKNPPVFLEVKRKTDNFISKNRSQVDWNNLPALFETGDIERYVIGSSNGNSFAYDEASRFFFSCKRQGIAAGNPDYLRARSIFLEVRSVFQGEPRQKYPVDGFSRFNRLVY